MASLVGLVVCVVLFLALLGASVSLFVLDFLGVMPRWLSVLLGLQEEAMQEQKRRIVGFTGTRIGLTDRQKVALNEVLLARWPLELHHGDCEGGDETAHCLCDSKGNAAVLHPPKCDEFRAFCSSLVAVGGYDSVTILPADEYLVRDEAIVRDVEELVACPREHTGERVRSGTWTTVRRARAKGIPITIIRPDGSVKVEPARDRQAT